MPTTATKIVVKTFNLVTGEDYRAILEGYVVKLIARHPEQNRGSFAPLFHSLSV